MNKEFDMVFDILALIFGLVCIVISIRLMGIRRNLMETILRQGSTVEGETSTAKADKTDAKK